eukprot:gene20712-22663_t
MTEVQFQYRVNAAAHWTTIAEKENFGMVFNSEISGIDVTQMWDISDFDAFPDGLYELRAVVMCGKDTQSQTSVVVGKIDRTAPLLVYAESLATRPVFTADDQVTSSAFGMFKGNPFPITVTVTEPILCMGLNPVSETRIESHFVLTIFGTEFGGSPIAAVGGPAPSLAQNDDLYFKCIGSTIELTLTATGMTKFANIVDMENGETTTSTTLAVHGVVDHAGNVMASATVPVAVGGFASIAKQLTQVTDTNVNHGVTQIMDQVTLLWEYIEDMKQETRKQHKYTIDLIEQKEKPQEERKLLLALPMTYAECLEMNVDDHAAT